MPAANTRHPDANRLRAFVQGRLNDADSAVLEAHLADCPTCCTQLSQLDGADTLQAKLKSAVQPLDSTGFFRDTAVPASPAAPPSTPTAPPDHSQESEPLPVELVQHKRYRVLRLLGKGGMGAVYQGEHLVMQRPVALKVINRALTANPVVVERFRREVRAAARLSHPNIVTTYDAEDAGETHLLVMEYVEGVSLGRWLKKRGPLPVAEACAYVRQAALGLQHAHERGMVHRDIKPDNLMLVASPVASAPGVVKVLDFGLAVLTAERGDGLTESNIVMGTPDFMAPEQAEDPRSADIRADVYSLGCTLYHLLTGQVPYPAPTTLLRILAHREQPLPSIEKARPEVPAGLASVLARMLAKKPKDRYATPGEVAAALEPFTKPAPVDVADTFVIPVVAAGPRRPRRRGPVVALAALLLVGMALIAAAVTIYRIHTDQGELVITTESDDVEVVIKQGGKQVDIIDTKTDKQIRLTLRSGTYELELKGAPKGLKLTLDKVTLMRGDTILAKIERNARPEPKPVAEKKNPTDKSVTRPQTLEVARRFPWPGRNPQFTRFSEDSRWCVAWGDTGFRVWETETGQLELDVGGSLPRFVAVRFLPIGKQLLSSHNDGSFRRWDLKTGKLLGQFRTVSGWPSLEGFSHEGESFCSHSGSVVTVWDLKTGKERFHVKPLHEKAVLLATAPLSPDGKRLLTIDNLGSAGSHVRVFAMGTGKQLLSKPTKLYLDSKQSWSADGRRIYLYGRDFKLKGNVIACLDADTGEIVSTVRLVPDPSAPHGIGYVHGVAYSRDNRYFAVNYPAANLILLYDTHTGKLLGMANGPNAMFSLSFSPNGRYVACGGQNEVVIYRLPDLPVNDIP